MMLSAQQAGQLLAWTSFSVAASMYNKWLMGPLDFNFPFALSFTHMAGAAVVLNAYLSFCRSRQRADQTKAAEPGDAGDKRLQLSANTTPIGLTSRPPDAAGWVAQQAWWMSRHGAYIVPVSAMFAAGVCLRNSAFVGLPLPLMQLLASCAPLGTYALSVAVGMNAATLPKMACMVVCIVGVAIAVGDRSINYSGLAMARHATGVGLDVAKGVALQMLIHKLTAGPQNTESDASADPPARLKPAALIKVPSNVETGLTKDGTSTKASRPPLPLSMVMLAMYSPLCAAMLAVPAVCFDMGPALRNAVGRPPWFWLALAGNVGVALGLNLVAVSCLHNVGAVTLSLTAFVKNWGLVVLSTLMFGREVAPRFVVGMLVTTAAVAGYANLRL